ncbi:MAG: tRNA (adenosine(37)-N6)-dimethylallyltransferase MiaA [Gammaproteobacteria bacterium]|nr:tRNA (adenosine(37)-N6)-dimethylallyltransferase MiaA [Gammaproteobacteria bacterium]
MSELIIQKSVIENAPKVIFIMGPTASGKTDLAVECVRQFSCDIISVDSALVYKHMDIGTAKPDDSVLHEAPHRLINIIEPTEAYSAASFRKDALREMTDITASGRIPVLAGGTMLYYKALQEGLSPLPSADTSIRQEIEQQAEEKGWEIMHQMLAEVDPDSARRIHMNDPQRIQRALEVYRMTGQSMTELWQNQQQEPLPYDVIKIALVPDDREQLRQKIAERFYLMLEQGLVNEVRSLMARGDLNLDMPSMRCVGYRQVWEHLEGKMDYDEMIEKAINATRQLAKRQLTWLRKEQMCNFFDTNRLIWPEIMKKLKYSLSL